MSNCVVGIHECIRARTNTKVRKMSVKVRVYGFPVGWKTRY